MALIATTGQLYLTEVASVTATAANAIATVTIASSTGKRHHVLGLLWSYSAAPTGGRLTSTGLEGDEIDMDITAGGPGPILFPPAVGSVSTAVTLALAAGGAGITGKLTVWYVTR